VEVTETAAIDGEPWEVALEALEALASALKTVAELAEGVERQLINARMQDALDLGEPVLRELYPEAMMAADEPPSWRPKDNPYEFAAYTDDAARMARARGAIDTAGRIVDELVESQPRVEG
jgi:hypothetical protein